MFNVSRNRITNCSKFNSKGDINPYERRNKSKLYRFFITYNNPVVKLKCNIPDKSATTRLMIYAVFIRYFWYEVLIKITNAVKLPIKDRIKAGIYKTMRTTDVAAL